ncbi:MAG: uroporphyrinogen decarboxylase family protein [Alkalispirochaetaceae bacterium]
MTGKERIFAAFKHESTDKVPWVPFAGVHAGKLIGETARTVYTDEAALIRSLEEVHKLYRPDGQPIMFDLQIEAEFLGCELLWSEDAPPTVTTHPLEGSDEIPETLPTGNEGRLEMALNATRHMKETVGNDTALYGLFCGPFTLASHLRGTNIFMDMFDDPEYVARLLDYTTKVGETMAKLYVDAGADVIASVDPLVSQISPDHFQEFLSEPYTRLFDSIRERGAFSSFFVCGDATRNIEVMCKTGPDGISIDENINMAEAKKTTDKYNVTIAGNIPLASVMLFGNQQDNMKVVIDELDSVDHHNLIVSPGCDMPYDTPIENTVACAQAVQETEQSRELVANYSRELPDIEIEIPDYDSLERPLIEVFTIDSDTCAACTYMFRSAMDAKQEFGEGIDVVEYKATNLENIVRAQKMGVKQLPSIYINGDLAYESIIPSREALNARIKEARS